MEAEKQTDRRRWVLLVLLVLLLGCCILGVVLFKSGRSDDTADTPKIAYAEGVTVVEDPDALQKAVDEMYEKVADGNIALEFKNDAKSEDGENFTCYVANSLSNKYDMYLQFFSDSELKDQLLLTGLIRPGEAFDNLTLEKALEPGEHTVYVAFTQVEEDLETIHGQVIATMNFSVT